MNDASIEANEPAIGSSEPSAFVARARLVRRARNLALVALVAMVIVAWSLYNRPSRTYQVSENQVLWHIDVRLALALPRSSSNGAVSPEGQLGNIAGVGKIVEVIVDRFSSRKGEAVLFLTGVDANYAGLAYLNGYPPPGDSCSVHLSGPWWQISPVNVMTMGCARGFHFTGGA